MIGLAVLGPVLGLAAGAAMLRRGRGLSPSRLESLERYASFFVFPVLLLGAGWLIFRLHPAGYARILAAASAGLALAVAAPLSRKYAGHWRPVVQASAAVIVVVVLAHELLLASAAAGMFPANFPQLCVQIGGVRAVDALARGVRGPDRTVRLQALTEMENYLKAPVTDEIQKFQPPPPIPRELHQAVPALIEALGDYNDEVRVKAASLLRTLGDPSALNALVSLARDRNPNVRSSARSAILSLKDPSLLPTLLLAEAENPGGQGSARLVDYGYRMSPWAIPPLLESLSDPDDRIRIEALKLLAKVGGREAYAALIASTRDKIPAVRATAVSTLVEAASDARSKQALRIASIRTGRDVGESSISFPTDAQQILGVMLAALNDPDSGVRAAAAGGIGDLVQRELNVNGISFNPDWPDSGMQPLDTSAAIAPLRRLLNDPGPGVREAAAKALTQCTSPGADPNLVR